MKIAYNSMIFKICCLGLMTAARVAIAEPPAAGSPAAGSPAAGTPAAPSSAQIEAGEPRADTSHPSDPPATPPPAAQAHPAPPRAAVTAGRPPVKGNDRVDLGTATVTGDREQPKVMYIVPWKRSDIGDLSGKPMNSLLDEALTPVDRDEFRREVVYYGAVKATSPEKGSPKPGAGPPAANQGEK